MLAWLTLQLVFVHANGKVALERAPGDAAYVLFDKGREPTLRPDGKRVVYWASAPGLDAPLVWADVDGGARGTFREGNLRSPHYSPDGKQLLWGEMVGGQWAVMRAPAADRAVAPTLVFRTDNGVFQPSWLPDGSGIIVHDLDSVFWVALDGKVTRKLAVAELTGGEGGISSADRVMVCPTDPNRLLLSVENGDESSALFTYDLVTKKRARLTPNDLFAFEPNWSRDGRAIYFRGSRAGKHRVRDGILRIAADGSALIRIAPGSEPAP
jgi:Tol biopolymer transport system component